MASSDHTRLIKQIETLPTRLRQEVAQLDDSQLDTPYRDGGWTVRQVVHHLVDSHMNGIIRMKLTLTEDKPTLKTYDQDAWAALADGNRGDIEVSLAALAALHARWCRLLYELDGSAWQRSANHPEDGGVTVETLLHDYADHGERHLGQITALKAEKGWK